MMTALVEINKQLAANRIVVFIEQGCKAPVLNVKLNLKSS